MHLDACDRLFSLHAASSSTPPVGEIRGCLRVCVLAPCSSFFSTRQRAYPQGQADTSAIRSRNNTLTSSTSQKRPAIQKKMFSDVQRLNVQRLNVQRLNVQRSTAQRLHVQSMSNSAIFWTEIEFSRNGAAHCVDLGESTDKFRTCKEKMYVHVLLVNLRVIHVHDRLQRIRT